MFFDQAARFGKVMGGRLPWVGPDVVEQASAVVVDVGHKQRHGATLGNFPGFVQVGLGAVGAGVVLGGVVQNRRK